jgi:hypothetical protein
MQEPANRALSFAHGWDFAESHRAGPIRFQKPADGLPKLGKAGVLIFSVPFDGSEINTVGFAAPSSDSRSRSSLSSSGFLGVIGGFGRENLAAHRCSNLL